MKTAAGGPAGAKTLADVLTMRANLSGDKRWLTLYEKDSARESFTFGEFYEKAARAAGSLAGRGILHGDRVLIILPTSIGFFETFFGALLLGAVPVPLYPPVRLNLLGDYEENLKKLAAVTRAKILVTEELMLPIARGPVEAGGTLILASPEELRKGPPFIPSAFDGSSLGLLQFTSGSTGVQKGVALTHSNLLANIRAVGSVLGLGEEDAGVSWLPLYHDMGLIGMAIAPLYWGLPLYCASPMDFLRRPARWLRMIFENRATVTAAPNFAYSLAARKVRDSEIEGIDLSSLRVALCGAEPINPETVRAFTGRFKDYGLSPKSFLPAYGLAENTLAVTFSGPGEGAGILGFDRALLDGEGRAVKAAEGTLARVLVSVGKPLPTVEVSIVNELGEALPEGRRGEICVKGPSVMAGYFENPEATGKALAGGRLHTGDLGFVLGGDLYICGRLKDLVIRAGRNYFAEDLEAAAAVEGLRPGGVAVFSTRETKRGVEEIVVVAETARPREGMEEEIRTSIVNATGCRPDRVVLVAPHTIPKTSSGKIQRFMLKNWYEEGKLAGREGKRGNLPFASYLLAALKDFFSRIKG
ncbi:fatty acyl-AMP ligase [bacterium]|nr:MAG: fatty acyl-AMP ligase [bacterium]